MKNLFIAALALAPVVLACSKSETNPALPSDSGCSEISVIPMGAHSLNAVDVATANGLFVRNNIDNRNFRYVRYSRELVQTYFPPYTPFNSQGVTVEEYTNGLRIFTGQSNFVFKDGVFTFRAGQASAGTTLSPQPVLNTAQLRGLFLATVAQFDPSRSTAVQAACVSCEFGYYNLNAGTSNTSENLVKAWKVTMKNSSYPFAYYEDNAARLIYYDNGIRTFR